MSTRKRSWAYFFFLAGSVSFYPAFADLHLSSCQTPVVSPVTDTPRVVKRVAIIGAGAAGSSAAYYLNKFATAANVSANITVFEAAAHIGGRSTTVNVFGDPAQPVELGASIFVEVNRNLVGAVKEFGLGIIGESSSLSAKNTSINASAAGASSYQDAATVPVTNGTAAAGDAADDKDGDDDAPGGFGVWNGAEFVWRMDDRRPSWWNTARLVWRYGLAPLRTQNLMREVIGRFLRLYDAPHFPFASLTDAAHALGLVDATAATGAEFLAKHGIVTAAGEGGMTNASAGSGEGSSSNRPVGGRGDVSDTGNQSASSSSSSWMPSMPSMGTWSWPWSASMPGSPASYADEIIQASTRVNYAQNLARIHGLETMVCMAAEGGMSVRGGNWQIFARMLDAARARVHLGTRVTSITTATATNSTSDPPALVLHTARSVQRQGGASEAASSTHERAASDDGSSASDPFDAVVLAAPFRFADLAVRAPLRLLHTPDRLPFVRLHVTLFASPRRLAPRFFGLPAGEPVPQYVLTTLPPGYKPGMSTSGYGGDGGDGDPKAGGNTESGRGRSQQAAHTMGEGQETEGMDGGRERAGPAGFFSVSRLRAVRNPYVNGTDGRPRHEYVYKIFSPVRPSDEFVAALLGLDDPSNSSSSTQSPDHDAAAAVSSSSAGATPLAATVEALLPSSSVLSPASSPSSSSSASTSSSAGPSSVPSAQCSKTRADDGTEVGAASVNSSGDGMTWRHDKVWYSYPLLFPRVTFDELRLANGLYYTGGIESFISTMETSSLMGMNVARLIVDEWSQQQQKST